MKIANWLCFGVPIVAGVGMLLASQPKGWQLPPTRRIHFIDRAEDNIGRKLTPAESTMISSAIDSIGTPPPATVVCTLNNARCTLKCANIAATLRSQLNRPGGIEAETGPRKGRADATTKPDGKESTEGDFVNISEDLLRNCPGDAGWQKWLQIVLLHEYIHKKQNSTTLSDIPKADIEAYRTCVAYKDAIGMTVPDPDRKAETDQITKLQNHQRIFFMAEALGYVCYVRYDTTTDGSVGDSLIIFRPGNLSSYSYPFGPMRASDMMIFENYFLLPDSHCLGLVCGGMPSMNSAQLLLLDIYHGEVVGTQGSFDFPGMFFYSMTHSLRTGLTYFLDTLNQQIVTMADMNVDSIPETILSTYASAFWPGFGPLLNMRGVDAGSHPYLGAGLSVNHFDIHFMECVYPYDSLFFLPDYDGNNIADACLRLPRYEFLVFTPVIQVPYPWPEDVSVMLHATWEHDVEVWTTDPQGEILIEPLGMMHMVGGVDAECMLSRALMPEEFILAMDMQTGELSSPVQIVNPVAQELTLILDATGLMHLRWEAVPGAGYYAIYESDDPFEFPPEPTYFTETNEIVLPFADEVKFYRVTAVK